MRSNGMYEM